MSNQSGYTHYVIFLDRNSGQWKIESGWEYIEDACDQQQQIERDGAHAVVVSSLAAKRRIGDLVNPNNWSNIF